jgi:hypothetical protein
MDVEATLMAGGLGDGELAALRARLLAPGDEGARAQRSAVGLPVRRTRPSSGAGPASTPSG